MSVVEATQSIAFCYSSLSIVKQPPRADLNQPGLLIGETDFKARGGKVQGRPRTSWETKNNESCQRDPAGQRLDNLSIRRIRTDSS